MDIIKIPEILLPKKGTDYSKWSAIACDQFTSEKSYWDDVAEITRGAHSTYHITFPEVFLGGDEGERIRSINAEMERYIREDFFERITDSFILTERTTKYTDVPRYGLVLSVDLDAYDFKPFNKAYIKATEGTILERLPVRIKIRENASLELPHILLLIDDRKKSVIEPLKTDKKSLEILYDFDLMKEGGHIKGYRVTNAEEVIQTIYALLDRDTLTEKYGSAESNFLFAVGDGNHSLATAKACWETLKKSLSAEEQKNHPARYALVELMNLYDDALKFEPIHRVIFNADSDFLEGLKKVGKDGIETGFEGVKKTENGGIEADLNGLKKTVKSGAGKVTAFDKERSYTISVSSHSAEAIKEIQSYIDTYSKTHPNFVADYIHGEAHLKEIVKTQGGLGILMPSIQKSELFPYVVRQGVLPKKAFSMGEAEEKRYYLEAKKIR
ncbi:MAG: DUF1015 domain-containing protein [Clostridiales bacterium]|jgi:hypothetical protein|nr:DUF1015 domain-containing protein [Clostridiales bacterium]